MKSFAVIGLGRFGMAVVKKLFSMGYEVLAVDIDMEKVNTVADFATKSVCADAKEEGVLKQLGIKNCGCVVVAIGNNITDSMLTTLALKEMGIERIVCKARNAQHKKILKKIGADEVVIPEYESGVKTAIGLVSNKFIDIIDISEEYGIENTRVPESWVGKSIGELSVRKHFDINIVAIRNSGNERDVNINPSPEYKFKLDDIIVIVGKTEDINRLNERL